MSHEVDTRVTPSLHPLNVHEIEGYDEDTAPHLGQVETAFSETYLGLISIHNARDASKRNPSWNEAQQVIETQVFAEKVFARFARSLDSAKANMDKAIGALEQQLTAPVEARAGHAVSAEIRSFVKGLDTGKRITFMQKAIADGDHVTVSAVLGAPHFLSGLEADAKAVLTRLYHEKASPAVAKRVTAMKGARDLLINRGALVHAEMQKAVGAHPAKVQALRAAKTEAERAFVLKDL